MYSLRTDPDRMLRHAEKMTADLNGMEDSIRIFAQIVQGSEGYWSGAGAEAARRNGSRCAAEAEEHCSRIRTILTNMIHAAETYRTAEQEAAGEADRLPAGGQ